jgi:hypothetical protein
MDAPSMEGDIKEAAYMALNTPLRKYSYTDFKASRNACLAGRHSVLMPGIRLQSS